MTFLQMTVQEIRGRIAELEPAVAEHERLKRAEAALVEIEGEQQPAKPAAPPRQPKPKPSAKPRSSGRGRPRGSGKRAKQAEEIVTRQPGITIPEIAAQMGIQANYLYRVMPQLQNEGKVVQRDDDKTWWPAGTAT